MTVGPDVNYEELARSTDEFNAAQLKAVCVEAGMIALREGATKLTHEHFLSGIAEGMFRSLDVCYATDVIIADTQCKQRRRMTSVHMLGYFKPPINTLAQLYKSKKNYIAKNYKRYITESKPEGYHN